MHLTARVPTLTLTTDPTRMHALASAAALTFLKKPPPPPPPPQPTSPPIAPETVLAIFACWVLPVVLRLVLNRKRALTVKARSLKPNEIMMGAIWIGPGGGPKGDGDRPDPGQSNADATIEAALRHGVREFDTAPWYGSGASEERLGRAIVNAGTKAAEARITTKAGRLFREPDGTPALAGFDKPKLRGVALSPSKLGRTRLMERRCVNDFSAEGARTSLAESLARMGLPRVHGLRMHDPNDNSNNRRGMAGFVDEVAQALAPGGMVRALSDLREAGSVDEIGLGMNCNLEAHQGVPDEILRLLRRAPRGTFDSALLAGGWNLLTQAGMPCYAACEAAGVKVHVAGVFCSGLLVGGDTYAYKKAPPEMVERAQAWRALAAKHGCSLPAVAIAFAALPVCVSRVVLGMASSKQVDENMRWVAEAAKVPPAIWAEAKAAGLLGANVPIPPAADMK